MKTIPVSFLVAGMLLPTLGLAQPPPPDGRPSGGEDPRRQPRRPFVEAWERADLDHDGFITRGEFNAMPRVQNLPEEQRAEIFGRLDKNEDGKLGRDELMRFGRPHDGKPAKRLWDLDLDKSGGISFEEFKEGQLFKKLPAEKLAEVFKRLDTDGDGLITPKDKPEPPFKRGQGKPEGKGPDRRPGDGKGEPPRLLRLIQKLDTNGDGAVSFEEFRVGPGAKDLTEDEQEDQFEKLDRNHDQKLTRDDTPPPRDKPVPPPSDVR